MEVGSCVSLLCHQRSLGTKKELCLPEVSFFLCVGWGGGGTKLSHCSSSMKGVEVTAQTSSGPHTHHSAPAPPSSSQGHCCGEIWGSLLRLWSGNKIMGHIIINILLIFFAFASAMFREVVSTNSTTSPFLVLSAGSETLHQCSREDGREDNCI